MPDIEQATTIVDLILKLGVIVAAIIGALLLKFGKVHFGSREDVSNHALRIGALEAADIQSRGAFALYKQEIEQRMKVVEKETVAIVRMDKRTHKIAVLLSLEHPDIAKNINLLGEE